MNAERQLTFACLSIALGGVLLALQLDGDGAIVGTGYAPLGIGAVVALAALLLAGRSSTTLPRDLLDVLSTASAFLGLAFLVAGVLAPGGSWLFFEVLILLWLLTRRRPEEKVDGPMLAPSACVALALMLLLRLWIAYQGSENRWQLMEISVPILSSIPWHVLDPIKTIQLGAFDPTEMGLPATGMRFGPTLALWSSGFAAVASGLMWRSRAAYELENDRIHQTIQTLPQALARLVERLIPEEDWKRLGLHGLSERMRCKRIEALVEKEMRARREFDGLLRRTPLLAPPGSGAFATDIESAMHGDPPPENALK
ncbi:MAG TPA: hypothetical protein VM509_08560 [Planctomycetota bacterium]|nr:hypothetical protein [Planctomycetota bacterium]